MRVKAIAEGHVGNPITVLRRYTKRTRTGIETIEHEVSADYIHKGDEFEWHGPLGKWMTPIEPTESCADSYDKKTVMAALDAKGIKYFKGASIDKLQELLTGSDK